MKPEESIAKEVYQKIKYDILNLSVMGGDFLTLADLSKKYGVSKTPVRDALNELEKEGYLRALPRKGYFVIPVTQNDVRECFQMRVILEKAAASLVCRFAGQPELDAIMELAKKFPKDGEEIDIQEFNRLNNIFHMSIIRATHNSLIAEVSARVMENLLRILLQDSKGLDYSHEYEEHIAISQALLDRDSERAEQLIVEHIVELQRRIYSTGVDIM